MKFYYVYVIQSTKDSHWYTGYTNDLKKQLQEHDKGRVFSTRNRRPCQLIYYEACLEEKDTKVREKYLKSGMGKRCLNNRLKTFLNKGLI